MPYDSAAVLDSDAAIAAYLDEAFRDGDVAMIAHALGVVARLAVEPAEQVDSATLG